jgi:hypothetical protein
MRKSFMRAYVHYGMCLVRPRKRCTSSSVKVGVSRSSLDMVARGGIGVPTIRPPTRKFSNPYSMVVMTGCKLGPALYGATFHASFMQPNHMGINLGCRNIAVAENLLDIA